MKIALVGTHSTGKTSLLNEFTSRTSYRVYVIVETARKIIERGFPMGKDAHVDSYINYVNDQIRAELLFNPARYDILISDRTILDTLCYARINAQIPRPTIPTYLLEMLESVWLLEKEMFDLHIYIPIEFELVKDGIRDEDEQYRVAVSNEIKKLLDFHHVNYVTIKGTIEERVLQLSDYVNKWHV